MRTRTKLFVLALTQIVLWVGITGESGAIEEMDGDYPFTIAPGVDWTAKGNPLSRGDEIFALRGTYRFFRGDLGLETLIGRATPSTDFFPEVEGEKARLLLFDLSVVWYPNYRKQEDRVVKGTSRIKPEILVFGGPGYASLRVEDVHRDSQLGEFTEDFFTLNAGVGVNLYWFRGDERTTSRWFVRPELRARWFTGRDDTIDWGGGIVIGRGFGKRQTRRALDLRVRKACEFVTEHYPEEPGDELKTQATVGVACLQAMDDRQEIEELHARVTLCGARCKANKDMQCIDQAVEVVRETVAALDCSENVED